MPTGAAGTGLLEGSSPRASVSGAQVRVQGPFAPGGTPVQVACEVPASGASLELTQHFPADFDQLAVIVKKVGATRLMSPQIANQPEMPSKGETFIAAPGGPARAKQRTALTLADLPHHNAAPRWVALGLAIAIVAVGVWAATRREDLAGRPAERKRLLARRE